MSPVIYQWPADHIGLVLAAELAYFLFVNALLFLIWWELHRHNKREERREWQENFEREKRDR